MSLMGKSVLITNLADYSKRNILLLLKTTPLVYLVKCVILINKVSVYNAIDISGSTGCFRKAWGLFDESHHK